MVISIVLALIIFWILKKLAGPLFFGSIALAQHVTKVQSEKKAKEDERKLKEYLEEKAWRKKHKLYW